MYKEKLLIASRKESEEAKNKLKKIESTPTGIMGGESATHTTVTRTAMRKNNDNIKKEYQIRPVLNYLEEEMPYLRGVIPHPIAWHVLEDGDMYYVHSIDGPDVECVYERKDGNIVFNRLFVDEKEVINEDTSVGKYVEKGSMKNVIIGAALISAALIVILAVWGIYG